MVLERGLDRSIEGQVLADRLAVVDDDSRRLREVLKSGMPALQHVDVSGPVGEVHDVMYPLLAPPRSGAFGGGRSHRLRLAAGRRQPPGKPGPSPSPRKP